MKHCDENPGCDYFRYYPDEIKNCRPREGSFVGERTYNSEATAFYRSCDMGNEDNDIFMIPSNFVKVYYIYLFFFPYAYLYLFVGTIDWILVAEGMRCTPSGWTSKDGKLDGNEQQANYPIDHAVDECARTCSGVSSVFGIRSCDTKFCKCVCFYHASTDGTCVLNPYRSALLFKYVPKGNFCIFIHSSGLNSKFSLFKNC